MKAKLIFDLPEENYEFSNAINGSNMRSVLWKHLEYLRSELKYSDLNDQQYEAFKKCQKHSVDLLKEEKIDVYE